MDIYRHMRKTVANQLCRRNGAPSRFIKPHEAVSCSTKISGQPWSALPKVTSALCCVYPVIPTPETRGACLPKISSPHSMLFKERLQCNIKQILYSLQIFQSIFKTFDFVQKWCYIWIISKWSFKMAGKWIDKLDLQIISKWCRIQGSMPIWARNSLFPGWNHSCSYQKLQELGWSGNPTQCGHEIAGLRLNRFCGCVSWKSSLYDNGAKSFRKFEIVRLNYTTGNYSMFIEVVAKTSMNYVLYCMMFCRKSKALNVRKPLFRWKKVLTGMCWWHNLFPECINCLFWPVIFSDPCCWL